MKAAGAIRANVEHSAGGPFYNDLASSRPHVSVAKCEGRMRITKECGLETPKHRSLQRE